MKCSSPTISFGADDSELLNSYYDDLYFSSVNSCAKVDIASTNVRKILLKTDQYIKCIQFSTELISQNRLRSEFSFDPVRNNRLLPWGRILRNINTCRSQGHGKIVYVEAVLVWFDLRNFFHIPTVSRNSCKILLDSLSRFFYCLYFSSSEDTL